MRLEENSSNGPYLFFSANKINHLLQSTSSMLVQCNFDHLSGSIVDKDRTLFIISVFKEFLAKVIPERIWAIVNVETRGITPCVLQLTSHELDHMLVGLSKDQLDVVGIMVFELLLKITTTVLVCA